MAISNKLKTLGVAVSLLAGAQAANAITPWANGAPNLKVYTSGGAAQDKAYASAVLNVLAEPGTLDIFEDDNNGTVGGRFAGYYFVGRSTPGTGGIPAALPAGLAGQKIYLAKRSLGAAGYGVVPLAGNIPIDHLDIFKSSSNGTNGSSLQAAWTANGSGKWKSAATIVTGAAGQGSWTNYLVNTQSHGGFIGVDAESLLQPGTQNYPDPVAELSTGALTTPWPTTVKAANLDSIRVPTGGLVYGVGVTLDLYKALQVAQIKSGKLASTTPIGGYNNEAYLPSLHRNFLAAILGGSIKSWDDVKFVDRTIPTSPVAKSLSDPTVLAAAGIAAPTSYTIGVARRNKGAAIGAVAYAKLLNYPFTADSFPPATNSLSLSALSPYVKSPGGAAATESLLSDWQTPANDSGLNATATTKLWGLAIHSGDRNPTATQPWRYVKIDGYAPLIKNVASGNYPYWAEGEILVEPAAVVGQARTDLLLAFADALNSSFVAADINPSLKHPFGQSGVFATTKTDSSAIVSIPFDDANPVVGLSHFNGSSTHVGIVPKPFKNVASPANVIELQ